MALDLDNFSTLDTLLHVIKELDDTMGKLLLGGIEVNVNGRSFLSIKPGEGNDLTVPDETTKAIIRMALINRTVESLVLRYLELEALGVTLDTTEFDVLTPQGMLDYMKARHPA